MKKILASIILFSASFSVFGQSNPGFYTGEIPTAGQWNSFFSAKMDYVIPGALGNILQSNGTTWYSATLPLISVPQSANTVFSGPSSGSPANPTFRVLVPADLPSTYVMTNASITSISYTSSTTSANQVVDSVSASVVRSEKYLVQITSGSSYQVSEILIVQNGTTVHSTEYGDLYTGSSLATFSAIISGGNLELIFTPVNSVTTVKAVRTAINL